MRSTLTPLSILSHSRSLVRVGVCRTSASCSVLFAKILASSKQETSSVVRPAQGLISSAEGRPAGRDHSRRRLRVHPADVVFAEILAPPKREMGAGIRSSEVGKVSLEGASPRVPLPARIGPALADWPDAYLYGCHHRPVNAYDP